MKRPLQKLLQSIALAVLGGAPSLQAQIESLPQNTMFQDTRPGSYGLRAHGCIPNFNMPKPNDGVDAACVIDSITINTPANLNGSGGTLFRAWTLDVTEQIADEVRGLRLERECVPDGPGRRAQRKAIGLKIDVRRWKMHLLNSRKYKAVKL